MAYNFTIEWLKGCQNNAPDALSRNPVSDPQPQDMLAEHDICNQPGMSIREIGIVTNDGQDRPRLAVQPQMMKNTNSYSAQSLMDFQITVANYHHQYSVIGKFVSTSQ